MVEIYARRAAIRERLSVLQRMLRDVMGYGEGGISNMERLMIFHFATAEAQRLSRELRGCMLPSDWAS